MIKAHVERILSLGTSDDVPERLARHIRVANALALLGIVLTLIGIPTDAIGAPGLLVLIDVLAMGSFAGVWLLNARGHHDLARATMLLTANGVILGGVLELGGHPEIRSVFLPLVILPFLLFEVTDRRWLLIFGALPAISYFATGLLDRPPVQLATAVNMIYAPFLSFVMIAGGVYVFARIEQRSSERIAMARARAAQGARLVALGEMSSGIAHEIRNPLAAIHMAATQIATHPEDTAMVAELGGRIQRIVMRASRIIEGLRTFARDASEDPLVATPVERIVTDALELCGKRFADHGIALEVAPVSPDLVVECRAVQLVQVVVNLLANAYDAVQGASTKTVRLDVRDDGAWIELAVSDTGPGIPPEVRGRLFEPFYTTKGPDRGTGLGLSLSRGLVQSHHGTLELDASAPGTRFVIRVPRTQRPG